MTFVLKPPSNPVGSIVSQVHYEGGVWVSPDNDPNPLESLDVDLTTPESAQVLVSRYSSEDRLVSPNPGRYKWGLFAYEVNTGTAPVTPLASRAMGNTVYTFSSSGRAYGADPTIHGMEITAGLHPSPATVTTTTDSDVLEDVVPSHDGAQFAQGQAISGTGIPGGATILSVSGDAGAPESITISADATADGTGVSVAAEPSGTTEAIGLLITGNCGTATATDLLDAAIQVQSQNDQSRWQYGVNIGSSGLHQTNGVAFRLASATALYGVEVASSTLTNVFRAANVVSSGSVLSVSGNTSTNAINIASSNVLSVSAINIGANAPILMDGTGGSSYLQMREQTSTPAPPSGDGGRIFMQDNGAGKTQLVVRFASGATQVIATQP